MQNLEEICFNNASTNPSSFSKRANALSTHTLGIWKSQFPQFNLDVILDKMKKTKEKTKTWFGMTRRQTSAYMVVFENSKLAYYKIWRNSVFWSVVHFYCLWLTYWTIGLFLPSCFSYCNNNYMFLIYFHLNSLNSDLKLIIISFTILFSTYDN